MPEKNYAKLLSFIILPLLGLMLPIIIFFLSLQEKSMTFEVYSKKELLSSTNNIANMKVFINDNNVDGVMLHSLRLRNSGTEPIRPTDFESPIEIYVTNDATIYSAKVSKTEPLNIKVNGHYDKKTFKLAPFLFNQGDMIEIEMATSLMESYPEINARIAGVKNISSNIVEKKLKKEEILSVIIALLLCIFYAKYLTYVIVDVTRRFMGKQGSFRFAQLGEYTFLSNVCAFGAIILASRFYEISLFNETFYYMAVLVLIGTMWGLYNQKTP